MTFRSLSALDRRAFLTLSAASLTLPATARAQSTPKRVAVIGGGIIGASITYHLAREGAQVTLLERNRLASRASRGTFAWVNATWAKQPRHYHTLNQAGVVGWKRLQSTLNIPVRWGGSLEWFTASDRQNRLVEQIAEQAEWGEPAEMISRDDMAALEPNVNFGQADRVAYSPNDGAVDPVFATKALAAAAVSAGAIVKENCGVNGMSIEESGTVKLHAECGSLRFDDIVLATGADREATKMLGKIDIPQRSTPGVIVITNPAPRLINRIIVAPGVHIHQRDDGRIVLGEQDGAPDTPAHAARLQNRPERFPNADFANQHALRILGIAEKFVPGIIASDIEDVIIGWRPLPIDGHPVIGRSPRLKNAYLAIMHSGVSLAPIAGDLIAREILTGKNAIGIDHYRPDRAFDDIRRY